METSDKSELFDQQRQWFMQEGRSRSVADRRSDLYRIKKWIKNNQQQICDALYADFSKPEAEVLFTEILPVVSEIKKAIKHVGRWSRTERVGSPVMLLGTKASIRPEPKGVVLIIAPWNFPFMLTIGPLVSALAAGNAVALKPSELTPHTAQLIAEMIGELFAPEQVSVHQGGKETAATLLELNWDHVFFTGSTRVGKVVMEAAAKHLTPVTLELGGQNPVIVDGSANINLTGHRLAWGKLLNGGQSCISPNIVFVQERHYNKLKMTFRKSVSKMYADDVQKRMAAIVNEHHYARLQGLIADAQEKGADIDIIGTDNAEHHFLAPRWIGKCTPEMLILQEEIFGPLMAVKVYQTEDEIFDFLQTIGKPLVSYVFASNAKKINRLTERLQSGATLINETTIHFVHPNLPFGGVGKSGMGKSHGKFGFDTFSHQRSVLKQWRGRSTVYFAEPKVTEFKKRVLRFFTWRF